MVPQKRRYYGPFVQLQANTYLDDAVRAVGPMGELLFYRSLQIAKFINKDGRVSQAQLQDISRGIYGFTRTCQRLLDEKLWISVPDLPGIYIRQWAKYNELTIDTEEAKALDAARKREARARSKTETNVDVSARTVRTYIREENKDKSETRPPSGSGRVSLPGAARRGTGGAAQHPDVAAVRLELQRSAAQRRSKLNKPPSTGNGRAEHVDFSATLAKLTEAAERLNPPIVESDE